MKNVILAMLFALAAGESVINLIAQANSTLKKR